ncbi:MAG: ATP-NAD kinase family protein [Desulfobacterales bacterium]|nr:ATP-NAD kinase family protein [Desulfobacterales bacterium]
MIRIGLIINPVAGMGGRVGLKGTDGLAEKARALGALPLAPGKAARALRALSERLDKNRGESIRILAPPGEMGGAVARDCGFDVEVLEMPGKSGVNTSGTDLIVTDASDTREAAKHLKEMKVDLLLFAGGDGTARDVCAAVGENLTVMGIPAGVKIHSPVFARTPETAGELAAEVIAGKVRGHCQQEVLDIDEGAYRSGRVQTRLYGYLRLPRTAGIQSRKAGTPVSEASAQNLIALDYIDAMEDGVIYLIGPGSTTRPVMANLGLDHTLLGVDVIQDKALISSDASERELLDITRGREARIFITPIGGQGYLFGRGNHQFSPELIQQVGKGNIRVGATLEKIGSLRGQPFLVDTGDPDTDRMLAGYTRVITGYRQEMMYPIL